MPYLTLHFNDADDQTIYVDTPPRLQIATGNSLEFHENDLTAATYTTEDPDEGKKK